MVQPPFLDDPREVMRRNVARAVTSPSSEVAALHIGIAEHHAAIARTSGLIPLRSVCLAADDRA